jgi:hypothetical protein
MIGSAEALESIAFNRIGSDHIGLTIVVVDINRQRRGWSMIKRKHSFKAFGFITAVVFLTGFGSMHAWADNCGATKTCGDGSQRSVACSGDTCTSGTTSSSATCTETSTTMEQGQQVTTTTTKSSSCMQPNGGGGEE